MKLTLAVVLMLFMNTINGQSVKTDPYFVHSSDTVSSFGPASIVRHILEDRKGNIWLASWQGIIKYNGKLFTNYTLKEGLIPFHVYSLYEDKIGNVWFGTVRGGAYKYDGKTFSLFSTENGLIDDLIGTITEDRKGNIWLGTDGGVSCLDTSTAHKKMDKAPTVIFPKLPVILEKGITNYTTADGLCGNRVNSIIQDRTGTIWIGTRSGVSCYQAGKKDSAGKSKPFIDFRIKQEVPFTNVRCIKEDRKGRIWIGGQDGLYCYDSSIKGEASLTKVMPNFICYVYEDKAGSFWVSAGENKGMALYKYDQKDFTKVIEKNTDGDSQVFEITEDSKGNIWFGTMRGPCRYDGKSFTYFTK